MGISIYSRLKELEAFRDEVLSGAYPQRTVLGPGTINKNFIKAKSISGSMLDVSELSAVASKTGGLTVTGDLIAGSGSSTLGYSPTNGLYIGGATPAASPFKVATSGALEATGATIGGSISASSLTANTSGQIAGWTIDSAKLSRGNVGIGDSSGYRIWSGNLSSPLLANFSVDNSGNIKAAAGSIAGMTVDSAKMTVNNAGMGFYGGYNLWAGNATPSSAPFRVDTAGNMVSSQASITGAVTASSGSFTGSVNSSNLNASGGTLGGLTINGTLTIGSGGQIVWASGASYINASTVRIDGSTTASMQFSTGGVRRGSIMGYATGLYLSPTDSGGNISSGYGQLYLTTGGYTLSAPSYGGIDTNSSRTYVFSQSQSIYLTNATGIELYTGGSQLTRLGSGGKFYVQNSGATEKFAVADTGAVRLVADATYGIATGYSTLGSLVGRWAIYNVAGSLVGYIPVYNSIT